MNIIWQLFKNCFRPLKKWKELPAGLDWLLSVVEPLIVVALTIVLAYATYWLIFGVQPNGAPTDNNKRVTEVVKLLNDNWKVALILAILLFYRTVRIFLEQAEELFYVKRRKTLEGEPQEPRPNPLHGEQQGPRENP